MKNNPVERLINGIIKENPTLVLTLGMCPTLAVTTSAINGIGMGLSTTAVLMFSNLVISLGMVGALSIVRFRTAIKDPMDLVFLFWSISIGIICGAGLYEVALLTCLVVTVLVLVLENIPASRAPMMLVVNLADADQESRVLDITRKYSRFYKVRSRNLTGGGMDMIVEVKVKDESAFVKEVCALDTVQSASLIAHDGEVTF